MRLINKSIIFLIEMLIVASCAPIEATSIVEISPIPLNTLTAPDVITNMSFSDDGSLWTQSSYIIVHWDLNNNQNTLYVLGGCPGVEVGDILSETSSSVWASSGTGIWHFDGTSWEQNFPGENFGTLELSPSGGIWAVVQGNKLYKIDKLSWNKYESEFPENENIFISTFRSIIVDQNDQVWVIPNELMPVGSENLGVWMFDKNSWVEVLGFSNKRDNFIYLAEDSMGRIWLIEGNNPFGGYKGSIRLLNNSKDINVPFDISPPRFRIANDTSGNLWIASVSELYKFDGASLSQYPLPKIESSILSIAISSEDKICIGTEGEGVWCKERDNWQNYKFKKLACP